MTKRPQSSGRAGCEPESRASAESGPDDELPGLPGFSSWGAVYLLVFVVFVLVVVGLAVFASLYA